MLNEPPSLSDGEARVRHPLSAWLQTNSYRADDYPLERVRAAKDASVAVILPARQVAGTIGALLKELKPLSEAGLIDELIVVASDSGDETPEIAADAGARVLQRDDLSPGFGPSLGKGDALWRGVGATSGDIVVFMDTDTQNFGAHFLLGLLGPLFDQPSLEFVKGAFRRPFKVGGRRFPDEGGRVTELVARPLLNLYLPQLAGFVQPLAGEVALRRWLFESFSVPVGYGVEIGMLIDAYRSVGLAGMGQVDLGTRVDDPQHLRDLSSMAYAVTATLLQRVKIAPHGSHGSLMLPAQGSMEVRNVSLEERPPLDSLRRDDASGM